MLKKIFPSRELVSVEIGGEFLKLAHIKRTTGGIKILKLASKDIRTFSDDEITTFIQNYLTEHKITTQNAVTFISPRYTINKNIELPSINPNEIKEIIKLQAGRYTPYSKEEIIIDYIPIGVFKGGYTKVLLVIVNRDIIKKYQDIIERTGLRLKKVILGKEIIAHWFGDTGKTQTVPTCLLHFDTGGVDFLVVNKDKIIFARNIPLDYQQLVYEGGNNREKFVSEIKSSLESYQTENVEKLTSAIMVGLTDKLDDIKRLLEDQCGLSIETETYLDRISFSPEALPTKESATKETSFLPVLFAGRYYLTRGLIDLTPEEIRLREIMAEKSRALIITATLVMFVLIMGSVLIAKKISAKENLMDSLKQTYDKDHRQAEELKKNYKQTQLIRKHLVQRAHALDCLIEMYKLVPETIWLAKVDFEEGKMFNLEGTAESEQNIASFVESLNASSLFKEVQRKRTERRTDRDGKESFEFQLTCDFELTPSSLKAEK